MQGVLDKNRQARQEAEMLGAGFKAVEAAARAAANAAAGIGAAADAAVSGVQRLASAMWDAAQARIAYSQDIGGGRSMGRGGPELDPFGFRDQLSKQGGGVSVGGGGGGGGGGSNPIQAELEAMQQGLVSQEELQAQSYARQQEVLNQALQQRLVTQEQYQQMMQQAQAQHDFAMQQSVSQGAQGVLSAMGALFQGSKKIASTG